MIIKKNEKRYIILKKNINKNILTSEKIETNAEDLNRTKISAEKSLLVWCHIHYQNLHISLHLTQTSNQ